MQPSSPSHITVPNAGTLVRSQKFWPMEWKEWCLAHRWEEAVPAPRVATMDPESDDDKWICKTSVEKYYGLKEPEWATLAHYALHRRRWIVFRHSDVKELVHRKATFLETGPLPQGWKSRAGEDWFVERFSRGKTVVTPSLHPFDDIAAELPNSVVLSEGKDDSDIDNLASESQSESHSQWAQSQSQSSQAERDPAKDEVIAEQLFDNPIIYADSKGKPLSSFGSLEFESALARYNGEETELSWSQWTCAQSTVS
ncbi:hypothetical protein MKEN_01375400 [Mycena kentingensis (nom. inval.)]|nr:hypothetical protein MKEN_01375400 [Mycena kentingensis (nom. inval.)]